MDARIRPLVERVWNYHQLNQPLRKAEAILVLCSHDVRVAERGAELFRDDWAPLLIFSGGLGSITRQMWSEPTQSRFPAARRSAWATFASARSNSSFSAKTSARLA